MPQKPLLPDCECDDEFHPCPVHGPGERKKAKRNAQRAVADSRLTQSKYDAWLEKYPPPRQKKWSEG